MNENVSPVDVGGSVPRAGRPGPAVPSAAEPDPAAPGTESPSPRRPVASGSGSPTPKKRRHPALETAAVTRLLEKRNASARRFRFVCAAAVCSALLFLAFLLGTILMNGTKAFSETRLNLSVFLDPEVIDPEGTRTPQILAEANYKTLIRSALLEIIPEASGRRERRALMRLVSNGAVFDLQEQVVDNPDIIGSTIPFEALASDELDMLLQGEIDRERPESERPISDRQLAWIDRLADAGVVERGFSKRFFRSGDSREPEMAGVWGATVGSFYVMLVTLAISFPLGVATAVYLEEFAPQNRLTDLIEININNLAAVPSIVFGLLGLALFLNVFHLPRSAPVVGGLVLSLLTLPVIIIASRAALKSVPPSIREAAYGMGASPLQALMHHTLPLALPGMLTGTIIGMARALGETAPLLMIGMVAFIVDIPGSPVDPATALPVQIYLWADSPERAFVTKTSAAILVLLAFLILMNALAVIIRNRTETRWH